MNVKEMVSEICKETGWNQCTLAENLGVTQPTISRILAGKQDSVSLKNYLAIQETYKKVCS